MNSEQHDKPPFALAIVGAGVAVEMALPVINTMDRIALFHLDDLAPSGMQKFTEFSSANSLLNLDVAHHAYIATPVASHFDLVLLAASNGLQVLVEKPMFLSVEEASKIPVQLRKNITPAFRKRYSKASAMIAQIHQNSDDNFDVSYTWLAPHPGPRHWKINPKISGGGITMDVVCHIFDLFEFLFGRIEEFSLLRFELDRDYSSDSFVIIEGKFSATGTFRIKAGWSAENSGQFLTYSSRNGDVIWKKLGGNFDSQLLWSDGSGCFNTMCDRSEEYSPMFSDFFDRENTSSMKPTFEDGIRNLNLVHQVHSLIHG